jgi:hypothetical protein
MLGETKVIWGKVENEVETVWGQQIVPWYTKIPQWAKYLCMAGGVILAVWFLWLMFWPSPKLGTTAFVPAAVPSAVKNVPKQEVVVKHIVVYEKVALGKKILLPDNIVSNPKEQVVAVATIPRAPWGAETITSMNTDTGVAATMVKAKERPFASFESSGAVGVRAGVSTRGGYVGEVYARQDLFQIKGVYVNVYGAVEGSAVGQPNAKAMVGVDLFRW